MFKISYKYNVITNNFFKITKYKNLKCNINIKLSTNIIIITMKIILIKNVALYSFNDLKCLIINK